MDVRAVSLHAGDIETTSSLDGFTAPAGPFFGMAPEADIAEQGLAA